MGHRYHHALSSVSKSGGAADDYLPLHQWFDESKAITADFRHAHFVIMPKGSHAGTLLRRDDTISTGRVVPVRLIGEQQSVEDLGFIPSFADWVRCIRPEPWMGAPNPSTATSTFAAVSLTLSAFSSTPSKNPAGAPGSSHFRRHEHGRLLHADCRSTDNSQC